MLRKFTFFQQSFFVWVLKFCFDGHVLEFLLYRLSFKYRTDRKLWSYKRIFFEMTFKMCHFKNTTYKGFFLQQHNLIRVQLYLRIFRWYDLKTHSVKINEIKQM